MAVDFRGLLSIHGLFKILELVLLVTTLLVARLGVEGSSVGFGILDDNWLGQMTTGSWLIINPIIIIGIILDVPMSWILDSLFSLVGSFLFIASGSRAIDSTISTWQQHGGSNCAAQLALGSLCLVTGFVLLCDAGFLIMKYGRRTK